MTKIYKIFEDYFPYDKVTLENMYTLRIYGMPVSFLLLDIRKTDTYCHFCANFLNLVIPNSIKKTGKLKVLNGSEHSWIETDNLVYDPSLLTVWLKDDYYEKEGVYDQIEVPIENVKMEISGYLNSKGCNELYISWIRDLEENFDSSPYGVFLKNILILLNKKKS